MMARSEWKIGKLGDLCTIEIGGTPSRSNSDYWDTAKETMNRWVSIRDLHGRVILETAENISDLGARNSNVKLQKSGTVLLSFKLSIGRVAFAGCDLFTNEAIAGLCSEEMNSEFLYYGLQQWDLLQNVDQAIKGATLNKEKLKLIEFKYPVSRVEQTQIANILAALDQVIEQTEAIIAKQQRVKIGLMQDLLTKGIDENGIIRSEATHEFKNSPLGRIPVEWEGTTLGNIICKHGGRIQTGPFGSQLHAYEYVEEGIPVVMPQDISPSGISTSKIARITEGRAKQLLRHNLLPGDLIFARRGDLSRCAWITEQQKGWVCGTGCLLIRPPRGILSPRWTAEIYWSHTTQVQVDVQAVGSTMPNLNTGILSALMIALPNYEEQVRIEEHLQAAEDGQHKMVAQLTKLALLKTGLMHDLLTGEMRVNDKIK